MTWDRWDTLTVADHRHGPVPGTGLIATDVDITTASVAQIAANTVDRFVVMHPLGLDLIGKPGRDKVEYFIRVHPMPDTKQWYQAFTGFGRIDQSCNFLLGTTLGYISPAPSWVEIVQTTNVEWKDAPVDGRHYFASYTFSKVMNDTLRTFLTVNQKHHPSVDHVLISTMPDSLSGDDTPLQTTEPFAPLRGRMLGQLLIGHLDADRQITHVSVLTERCVPEADAPEQAALIYQAQKHHEEVRARSSGKRNPRKRAKQGVLFALSKLFNRKP